MGRGEEGTKREERAALAVAITMKVSARLIHRGTVRGLHWGISARDDTFSSLGGKELTVEDAQSRGNTWARRVHIFTAFSCVTGQENCQLIFVRS